MNKRYSFYDYWQIIFRILLCICLFVISIRIEKQNEQIWKLRVENEDLKEQVYKLERGTNESRK